MCHAEPWFLETPIELCLDESFASAGKIVFCPHNSPEAKWTMHHVRKHSSVLHSSPQTKLHLHSMSLCLCLNYQSFFKCKPVWITASFFIKNSALELMTSNLQPHYSSDAACIREWSLNKCINVTSFIISLLLHLLNTQVKIKIKIKTSK